MGGVLLEEATVSVEVGDAWDGGAVTWGSSASFLAQVRNLRVRQSIQAVRATGAGSVGNRFHSLEGTLTIESLIPATGFVFFSTLAAGVWVRITTKEKSSLGSSKTWTGVITNWEWSASQGEPQAENIEVNLNAQLDA